MLANGFPFSRGYNPRQICPLPRTRNRGSSSVHRCFRHTSILSKRVFSQNRPDSWIRNFNIQGRNSDSSYNYFYPLFTHTIFCNVNFKTSWEMNLEFDKKKRSTAIKDGLKLRRGKIGGEEQRRGRCRLFSQRLFPSPALKMRGNLRKRKTLKGPKDRVPARLDAIPFLPPSIPLPRFLRSSWKALPADILFRIRPHSKLIKRHAHRLAFFRGTRKRELNAVNVVV